MNRIVRATLIAVFLCVGPNVAAAQTAAKPPGVVRIGIVQPQVKMGSEDAPRAAESVRQILAEYLRGPTIDVVLLEARLPSQYAIEAAQADCDFVLAPSLTHERSRANGALGKALGSLATYAPRIPGGNAASPVLGSVLHSVAEIASSTKAKDQMQLDYRLDEVGGAGAVVEDSAKRRAKSDGEDLLTPLVEQAAEAVGAAVTASALR